MKKLIFMTLVLMMMASAALADDHNQNIEFSAGAFVPGSGYGDGWDNGADFTLNYIYQINDTFAVEAGAHAYATEANASAGGGSLSAHARVNTTGGEFMGRLYHNFDNLRIYGSAGLGFYNNDIRTSEVSYSSSDYNSTAVGLVGKVGADIITDSGLYFGAYVKEFTNNENISYDDGSSEYLNLGGTTYNVVIGYNFY